MPRTPKLGSELVLVLGLVRCSAIQVYGWKKINHCSIVNHTVDHESFKLNVVKSWYSSPRVDLGEVLHNRNMRGNSMETVTGNWFQGYDYNYVTSYCVGHIDNLTFFNSRFPPFWEWCFIFHTTSNLKRERKKVFFSCHDRRWIPTFSPIVEPHLDVHF